MQTDWNKLTSISQIVGTVAIVLTLIFLSLQTRQQTQAITANTRQGALEMEISMIQDLLNDPELWYTDYPKLPGISDELAKKIMISNLIMFRSRENLWLQYNSGALDEASWFTYRQVLVDNIRNVEIGKSSWEFLSPGFNPEFVSMINQLVEEGP